MQNVADNAAKNFNILATGLNVLRNYFDSSNKIIFKPIKFLNTSTKNFHSFRAHMHIQTRIHRYNHNNMYTEHAIDWQGKNLINHFYR